MQVGVFAGVAVTVFRDGKPPSMNGITQRPAQGIDAVIHQLGEPRQALDMGHGEAVGHAGGIHGFGLRVGRQVAFFIEVTEAFGKLRSLGKCEQARAFGSEPLLMGRCVEPTAERRLEGVHGVPFLLF